MSDLEIIIECCKHLGLTKEETTIVLQIAHSPEERSDLVTWMRENIEASPEPVYVIIAAGEIQMKHRNKSKSPMFDSIILHIPHASSNFDFAGHDQYVPSWRKEAEPLIDWYTDELFIPTECDERIIPVVFDTCRTLVDVERMCNDPLECRELGITAYRLLRGKDGGNVVRIDDEDDIRYMKKYLDSLRGFNESWADGMDVFPINSLLSLMGTNIDYDEKTFDCSSNIFTELDILKAALSKQE